jgi:hypothetical protein
MEKGPGVSPHPGDRIPDGPGRAAAQQNNSRVDPAHLCVKGEFEKERRCARLHPSRTRHFEQSVHYIRYVRNHFQQNALEAVTCCICPVRDICNDSAARVPLAWPKAAAGAAAGGDDT